MAEARSRCDFFSCHTSADGLLWLGSRAGSVCAYDARLHAVRALWLSLDTVLALRAHASHSAVAIEAHKGVLHIVSYSIADTGHALKASTPIFVDAARSAVDCAEVCVCERSPHVLVACGFELSMWSVTRGAAPQLLARLAAPPESLGPMALDRGVAAVAGGGNCRMLRFPEAAAETADLAVAAPHAALAATADFAVGAADFLCFIRDDDARPNRLAVMHRDTVRVYDLGAAPTIQCSWKLRGDVTCTLPARAGRVHALTTAGIEVWACAPEPRLLYLQQFKSSCFSAKLARQRVPIHGGDGVAGCFKLLQRCARDLDPEPHGDVTTAAGS